MTVAISALAVVAGVAHVGFFVLEAVLWNRPGVHRVFGARDADQAALLRTAFFNLGFYNLFLGLGAIVGAWLWASGGTAALLVFCLAFMVAAAAVLIARVARLWRGALVQGLVPAIALTLLAVA